MIAASDDAVAGALGVVLLLALALTAFAQVARTDVPVWGHEAEAAWAQQVQGALSELASSAGSGVGASAPLSTSVPMRADAQSMSIPLLGELAPLEAVGAVGFERACVGFDATHRVGDEVITDLDTILAAPATPRATQGCLLFLGESAYSPPFAYAIEMGALLRIEGGEAVILDGPALELGRLDEDRYRLALTIPGLRGPAVTTSGVDDVRISFAPAASSGDVVSVSNAESVTWTIATAHPAAWRAWFEDALADAGFDGVSTLTCECTRGADGLGSVTLRVDGPRAEGAGSDLAVTLLHGVYDVSLG